MKKVKWTTREVRIVRRHRGPNAPEPKSVAFVVRLLGPGWTARKLLRLAGRLGLATPCPRWSAAEDDSLRKQFAAGRSDKDVARSLRRSRFSVRKRRLRLGLSRPAAKPAGGPRHPRAVGARLAALRRNWPDAATPAECDVLDALEFAGKTLTGPELASLTGKRWLADPKGLHGTVLRLARRGLLELVRQSRGPQGGVRLAVRLAPGVRRRYELKTEGATA